MHIYSKMKHFLICVLSFLQAGCISPQVDSTEIGACAIGQYCGFSGVLRIFRGTHASVGVLEFDGKCLALALPEKIYERFDRWDGNSVVVRGKAFEQFYDPAIVSYDLGGRIVAAGVCEAGIILFVEEIWRQ